MPNLCLKSRLQVVVTWYTSVPKVNLILLRKVHITHISTCQKCRRLVIIDQKYSRICRQGENFSARPSYHQGQILEAFMLIHNTTITRRPPHSKVILKSSSFFSVRGSLILLLLFSYIVEVRVLIEMWLLLFLDSPSTGYLEPKKKARCQNKTREIDLNLAKMRLLFKSTQNPSIFRIYRICTNFLPSTQK